MKLFLLPRWSLPGKVQELLHLGKGKKNLSIKKEIFSQQLHSVCTLAILDFRVNSHVCKAIFWWTLLNLDVGWKWGKAPARWPQKQKQQGCKSQIIFLCIWICRTIRQKKKTKLNFKTVKVVCLLCRREQPPRSIALLQSYLWFSFGVFLICGTTWLILVGVEDGDFHCPVASHNDFKH